MRVLAILLLLPMMMVKVALVLLGLIVVPIGYHSKMPELYSADENRPWTIWEMMIRNPVNGLKWVIPHPQNYTQRGFVNEVTLDMLALLPTFQWRFRHSGLLCSIRVVILWNRENYGELYLGWKLGSEPPDLDFAMSLRPYAEVGN